MVFQMNRRVLKVGLPALCAVALVLSISCEPGPTVEFTNETTENVTVYQGGEVLYDLTPGETRELTTRRKDWVSEIRVVAQDGSVVLEETITWDDLKSMDHRVEIESTP